MVLRIFLLLLFSLFSCNSAVSGLFSSRQQAFLTEQQAFQFSAERQGKEILFHWYIAEGYYLYQKELKVTQNGRELAIKIQSKSKEHEDPYFGKTKIFENQLNIVVVPPDLSPNATLTVGYQGCTTGLCYSPQIQDVKIANLVENRRELNGNSRDLVENGNNVISPSLIFSSEQSDLTRKLFASEAAVFWFFLLGLGLAFTPCVLPMLPLLSAIVIGNQVRPNSWRAFSLSLVYVQGMALTYTLLGLIVATIGLPFQIALQSPYVLGALSILFVILSLSMFGVFTLQLPASLQTKLTLLSQKQQSGAFGGVFLMGMIAGLVASPCTSAPLSGVLLYVAQSGNLFIGGVTLYLLALGMGAPLILITLFGNKILPKSGAWLENVKIAFGFVMLAVPIFLLSRILPVQWEGRLWSGLAITFLGWLGLSVFRSTLWLQVIVLILAIFSSKPLVDWLWQVRPTQVEQQVQFERVISYSQLQQRLIDNPKTYAMLDLYADWCVACKEFEEYTFSNAQVQHAFGDMQLLQVDMSKNSLDNKEISEKLKILGLPTILFFDHNGEEIPNSRITGFLDANAFLKRLEQIKQQNKK